jgi:hypothetical protein
MLGSEAGQGNVVATVNNLAGYLAPTLDAARGHRAVAWRAASEAGIAPQIAIVLIGIADLALRQEQFEGARRLIAAADAVRGVPARGHPDVDRITEEVNRRLGITFTEAAAGDWRELA